MIDKQNITNNTITIGSLNFSRYNLHQAIGSGGGIIFLPLPFKTSSEEETLALFKNFFIVVKLKILAKVDIYFKMHKLFQTFGFDSRSFHLSLLHRKLEERGITSLSDCI